MTSPVAAVALTLAFSACASAALQTRDTADLRAGTWGGDGISINVTDKGATLEFDCATGEIPKPLRVDAKGLANADGTYTVGPRGALRLGVEPDRRAAVYAAKISGDTLTLNITLTQSAEKIGPFTVRLGVEARLRKCR